MKRFRTTRRFASGTRKRAVWVNIPFGSVAFTETAGNQTLLVPEDWEASFTGLTNERAVLRAIVGELSIVQTTAGTNGGMMFWGIYLAGIDKATPVFTTTGMSDVSWLLTGARATTSSAASGVTNASKLFCDQIAIKAKRKLDTNSEISFVAQFGADAASPAGFAGGILRFLIARD